MLTLMATFGLGLLFGASVLTAGVVAVICYVVSCLLAGLIRSGV